MAVCPIDTGRYGSKEIREIFSEEGRLRYLLKVEAALAKALGEAGVIPREAAEAVEKTALSDRVKLSRVKEIEARTRHDLVAVVEALAEMCGDHGGYVHWGATSNDIIDTAWALMLRDALKIVEQRLAACIEVLMQLAEKHVNTIMPGRTHGQHASPITLGFKFAVYAAELARDLERLQELKKRLIVGKLSGAVGTMAALGEKAFEVEKKFMEILGLKPAEITTQVVCRDRFAELILWCALTGSSLDRIATEIRNLQRTEILEVAEGFEREQIGSSAMPHKQNPIDCEKISGLAKVLRGFTTPALENIPLWHERDLTNSSSERFAIPLSVIILEEMLKTMERVLGDLRIYPENMARNLELSKGMIFSEVLTMALARGGMSRLEAHRLVRELSLKAIKEDKHLREVAMEDPRISSILPKEEIDEVFEAEKQLSNVPKLVERALTYAMRTLQRTLKDA